MTDETRAPSHDALLEDLKQIRQHGAGRLRQLDLPALSAASQLTGHSDPHQTDISAIRSLLTEAIDHLGGGTTQDCAEYSLGLAPDTALWTAARRRNRAAELWGSHPDTFRKTTEPSILSQVAEAVLDLYQASRMRHAKLAMEARHPADSHLAVQWVTRFEAYYRIWTPVWALGGDLKACLDTRREPAGDHAPWDPDGREGTGPYHPEAEAAGYAFYALYRYTCYHLELKRFLSSHGGLWLASTPKAEQAIADAIYRIGWHNPLNEEDDAWLRRHLADSRHQELDHFKFVTLATSTGEAIAAEWLNWTQQCHCDSHDQPSTGCQVHATIAACQDYCQLIDQEWGKIADWYAPGAQRPDGIAPGELYEDRMGRSR